MGSTVRGGDRLRAALRAVEARAEQGLRAGIAEAAEAVRAGAVARLDATPHPYATGKLRARVKVKISEDGLKANVGVFADDPAPEAVWVEFGTAPHEIPRRGGGVEHHPGAAAKPFLGPEFHEGRQRSVRIIREAVARAVGNKVGVP